MLRSMYSGISGMRVNQTKLDVIGNNIANVGTTAFKGQRVRFQDMLSQNAGRAMAPSLNSGGVNPRQVGLGVQLAGIDTLMSQGNMQPTSRNLDVAIDGEGFFMVAKGPVAFDKDQITLYTDDTDGRINQIKDAGERNIMYTRDGSFALDPEGNLLTSDGLRVLGYGVYTAGKEDTVSIDKDGKVHFIDADSVDAGTKKSNIKATDDLKTLKIPEKVTYTPDGGTPEERRIISFTIEKDGLVKATIEGGKTAVLGQVAMASFRNPAGMEKIGGNLYMNSANSGSPIVRTGVGVDIGKAADQKRDNSKGYGDMLQGMLEMSNIDLAEQFTDMIVATRAFQASGKMISTGDEILQDIINLKR